jgi:hypothetical protein
MKQKKHKSLVRNYLIKHLLITSFIFTCLNANSQSDKYDWSCKLGGGSTYNINNGNTKDWVGNLKGSFFFVGIGFKNIHINFSPKYYNAQTKTELNYDDKVLPINSEFNFVFLDVTLSFEKELANRFFIEEYIGYVSNNITSNIVHPNGDELEIRNTSGITIGCNLIKYIKFYEAGGFLGPFINVNYNFIDFKKVSSELDNNALGFSFGVILKGIDGKSSAQNKNSKNPKTTPPPF